jgi:DNA processing protein
MAERGWCVVSGLAEGCDTEGHEGCLAAGGKTIAALAHGFGRIYPAKNKQLAERILESGGALITEYPPGTPPTRSSFIERDRLQSGLSLGIVVVETDIKGGTMHTVRHARDQGRGIAAISHPPEFVKEAKAQGNQQLIKDLIARPLANRDDLFRFAQEISRPSVEANPPAPSQSSLDLGL